MTVEDCGGSVRHDEKQGRLIVDGRTEKLGELIIGRIGPKIIPNPFLNPLIKRTRRG